MLPPGSPAVLSVRDTIPPGTGLGDALGEGLGEGLGSAIKVATTACAAFIVIGRGVAVPAGLPSTVQPAKVAPSAGTALIGTTVASRKLPPEELTVPGPVAVTVRAKVRASKAPMSQP